MKWFCLILAIVANCQTTFAIDCEFVENCRTGYFWDDKTCFCERVGMTRPTCDIILDCAVFFKWDPVACICAAVPQTLPEISRIPPTRPPRPTPCPEQSCRIRYVWLQSVSFK